MRRLCIAVVLVAACGSSPDSPDDPPPSMGGACPQVGLSAAAELRNVRATTYGASARVDFDMFDDAKDYRVYALPAAGDVMPGGTIKNAVYRCAGQRQLVNVINENDALPQSYAVRTRIASDVRGYTRAAGDATLGHVYTEPGEGRIPVYALGDSAPDSDNSCYFQRWTESRVKTYTTSETERTTLLANRWRDDGVAFYVPMPGTASTVDINVGTTNNTTLYVASGTPEAAARTALTPAFAALAAPADGTQPLMRVFYDNGCGRGHDELVAGKGMFDRAYRQGPTQPVDVLHWSGITGPTTLVIEALEDLCPFQGVMSATSRPARDDNGVPYPPFVTLDQMRDTSPAGELFVGGQGEATHPKAVARSCVTVNPGPLPEMDFRVAQDESFTAPVGAGFQTWTLGSPSLDVHLVSAATDEWGFGWMLGELWTVYADWAADTNGKLRMTAKTKATLAASTFVHVTMEVNSLSTDRRYPQILLSSVDVPIQDHLAQGTTVIVQTIVSSPTNLEVQYCDHRTWDVNDQCPKWDLYHLKDGATDFLAPNVEVANQAGVDRTNLFEVYASTSRVYVLLDGEPYGCVNLPAGTFPAGPTTVTFGDVLYHSGVDLSDWQVFQKAHYQLVATRHFSNLAFASGKSAPAWDEARLPCVAASALQ